MPEKPGKFDFEILKTKIAGVISSITLLFKKYRFNKPDVKAVFFSLSTALNKFSRRAWIKSKDFFKSINLNFHNIANKVKTNFNKDSLKAFIDNAKNINLKEVLLKKNTGKIAISIVVIVVAGAFAVGAMSNSDKAVEAQQPKVYSVVEVVLDEEAIGYVSSTVDVDAVIEEICSEKTEAHDLEATLASNIVYEDLELDQDVKVLSNEQLKDELIEKGDFKFKGYSLMVDDKEIGTLKTKEELELLLEDMKKPYLEEKDGKKVEEVMFAEDVQIVEKNVTLDEIDTYEEIYNIVTEDLTGVEEYVVKEGDTVWSISRKYGVDEDSIYKLNPELSKKKYLMIDQKLRVSFPLHVINILTTETVEYEDTIKFETEKKEDSSLYTTQSKIIRNGKEGLKKVTAKLIRKNGIEQDREVIKEKVIEKPVNAVLAVGTRKVPTSVSRGGGFLMWPAQGRISSRYGWRWGRMHTGLDIANAFGTPIYAADPGTIVYSGYKGGYGNLVIIDHGGGGVKTYYGHMQSSTVKVGETVARGQLIGYMGSTGNSTGSHVHFEVRINNQPMDPMRYLK